MTTKRILLIFGGVVVTVGLLVMVFVGGIVGFAIYQWETAKLPRRRNSFFAAMIS